MAEILGYSNQSQVLDLQANDGYQYTPAFGIYENGNPVRVVLINFVSDPSGNSDLTVALSVGGGQTGQPSATPSSVQVKCVRSFIFCSRLIIPRYLRASSVSQKGNFTWANQVCRRLGHSMCLADLFLLRLLVILSHQTAVLWVQKQSSPSSVIKLLAFATSRSTHPLQPSSFSAVVHSPRTVEHHQPLLRLPLGLSFIILSQLTLQCWRPRTVTGEYWNWEVRVREVSTLATACSRTSLL